MAAAGQGSRFPAGQGPAGPTADTAGPGRAPGVRSTGLPSALCPPPFALRPAATAASPAPADDRQLPRPITAPRRPSERVGGPKTQENQPEAKASAPAPPPWRRRRSQPAGEIAGAWPARRPMGAHVGGRGGARRGVGGGGGGGAAAGARRGRAGAGGKQNGGGVRAAAAVKGPRREGWGGRSGRAAVAERRRRPAGLPLPRRGERGGQRGAGTRPGSRRPAAGRGDEAARPPPPTRQRGAEARGLRQRPEVPAGFIGGPRGKGPARSGSPRPAVEAGSSAAAAAVPEAPSPPGGPFPPSPLADSVAL